MPPRTFVHAPPEAWQAVARLVHTRRNELGLTQAEAVAASGGRISLAVWSILENARQQSGKMDTRSLEGAAAALELDPDDLYRHLSEEAPFPHLDPDVVGLAALAGELSPEDRKIVEGFIRGLRAREQGEQ